MAITGRLTHWVYLVNKHYLSIYSIVILHFALNNNYYLHSVGTTLQVDTQTLSSKFNIKLKSSD